MYILVLSAINHVLLHLLLHILDARTEFSPIEVGVKNERTLSACYFTIQHFQRCKLAIAHFARKHYTFDYVIYLINCSTTNTITLTRIHRRCTAQKLFFLFAQDFIDAFDKGFSEELLCRTLLLKYFIVIVRIAAIMYHYNYVFLI